MADVFLAAVEGPVGWGFTKLAVVKMLRRHLAEDPEFVSMLLDEARITARLAHRNVVQLFEFGHIDDQYFLAIEHLEGQPLHRIERRAARGAVDVPRQLYYAVVSDVLAGLHHAHELADYDGTPLKIVHRDVTPHNVFVTYDGTVKVVDFGIAKAIGRATVTQHGIVKGKVRYMAPEQAAGDEVDRRTDIFAAGVMLWGAATGTKFWADRDDVAVMDRLCCGDYPASPRELCPDVPEEIDMICRRALAFRREDRYATAAEMRADLEAFLGSGSVEARKELASTMKQLFVPERAALRAVLEGSSLTSSMSIDAHGDSYGGISSAPRIAVVDGAEAELTERVAHTEIMPSARAPVADVSSLSPMVVAGGCIDVGSPPAFASAERAAARSLQRPGAAAAAAAFLILVVGALSATRLTVETRGTDAPRHATSFVEDRTTFAHEARPKADAPPRFVISAIKKTTGAHGAATHRAPASPSLPVNASPPESKAAPSTPPGGPRGVGRQSTQPPLDNTDPWRSSGH